MARYTGPKYKLCRREGVCVCDSPKCTSRGRRKYPPGMHGSRGYRGNMSGYAKQLRVKQRAKRLYGMMERQFERFFKEAFAMKGNTGENLLRLLERRLDNVVYRLGYAETRRQARQMVAHKHISVNGKVINIPSYIINLEDQIAIAPRALKSAALAERLESVTKKERPEWLAWDSGKKIGKIVSEPNIEQLVQILEPNTIVELYSK